MEKKTMDTLRTMVCGELDDIAKKGVLSHETLDILKDLLESAKNLEKIEKYQSEKEKEWDMGYSQRKYYIDADYDPYSPKMSYARGGRSMDGSSYGYSMGRVYDGGSYRGGMSYMDGNSYGYYNPRYDMPIDRRYSRTGSKDEMIEELHKMKEEATDQTIKNAITEAISKIK